MSEVHLHPPTYSQNLEVESRNSSQADTHVDSVLSTQRKSFSSEPGGLSQKLKEMFNLKIYVNYALSHSSVKIHLY